jgi:hypothetical protein
MSRLGPRGRTLVLSPATFFVLFLWGCALPGGPPGPAEPVSPTFYPPPPEEPRLQFLASYRSDRDVAEEVSAFRRFVMGEPRYSELIKPYGVAIHDGKLLICDIRRQAVVIYDLVGRSVGYMGTKGPGRLQRPINIAVAEDGTRYVADMGRNRVMVYGPDNRYLTAFGDPDRWSPSAVAVLEDFLYVADIRNGKVVLLDRKTGETIRHFGGENRETRMLPTNLDVDEDGNIWVADTGNYRVLKFSHRGELLVTLGEQGRGLGQFARPKGIAVDRRGRLYVVDAAFENVQVFNEAGQILLFFGGAGLIPGAINLPADVAVDYDNVDPFADRVAPGYSIQYLVLVTSQFGINKVNVYGLLKQEEEERGRRRKRSPRERD